MVNVSQALTMDSHLKNTKQISQVKNYEELWNLYETAGLIQNTKSGEIVVEPLLSTSWNQDNLYNSQILWM